MDQESYNTLQKADAALRRIDTALERLGDGSSRWHEEPSPVVQAIRISGRDVMRSLERELLPRARSRLLSFSERGRLGAAARWGKAKRKK
jgi:hypothetical protein